MKKEIIFKHLFYRSVLFSVLMLLSFSVAAQETNGHSIIHELNLNNRLYQICKNDIDGFSSQTKGGIYTYPSLRSEISDAMIARASTGKVGFDLLTSEVPADYSKELVSFFFYSDIDLNFLEPYDVKVDGQSLLTFTAERSGHLQISNQVAHADARFILIKRDGNRDGIGVFELDVPVSMLTKGEKATISVYGQKKGTNSWFMLFKAPNVKTWLAHAVSNEMAFEVSQVDNTLLIQAPEYLTGQKVSVVSDGKQSKVVKFQLDGDIAIATVKSLAPKKSFTIHYGTQHFEVNFDKGNGIINKNKVVGTLFYSLKSQIDNGWKATFTKRYRPDYYAAYVPFFDRKYQNGQIAVMNSSHQDLAWMERPEVCKIKRDTMLLAPIIKDAFIRDDYGFDIEDGLMLREYIIRHPEAKDKITKLLNRKLISVGATYNCPYEDMYSGEDLVREFYLGKRWVKKNFGGYDAKVYWNVDVPGRTMQFPQIMKKAGVNYMVISRHEKGLFHWGSPDGSTVLTYTPGHYGADLLLLSKGIADKMKYGAEQVVWWSKFFQGKESQTPLLSSQDMLPAIDYSDFIETWNQTDAVIDNNGNEKKIYLPKMELMTVDEYLPLAEKHATSIDTIYGERPNVWLYIHGPSHHYALQASRRASKLLPAAEKFMTVASFLDENKMPYPFDDFDEGWREKIYPDHGWGGNFGDITDDLFLASYVKSEVMGDKLLDKATNFIAQRVKTKKNKGIPVVLFNSLSWMRTDPVTVSLDFPKNKAHTLSVQSAKKVNVPMQLTGVTKYADGSIKHADVVFVAEDVPSIGYKTYYVKADSKKKNTHHLAAKQSKGQVLQATTSTYENQFYTVSFTDGGIKQVYDKEFNKNLFDTKQFKVGEIFTMQSVGNGAGEFGDVQQPTMKDFDQVAAHHPKWEIVESGDVYTTYQLTQNIIHAKVEQRVTIYHQLKRIQFNDQLLNWDGTLFRGFRTAYPVAMKQPTISHEVAFGTVVVGKNEIGCAGERFTPLCKDVHPRAIMDWFAANDDQVKVTLSSSVAAADWVNPTKEGDAGLLQHILLASRQSCNSLGNDYIQPGDHSYSHILTSNKVGEETGARMAKQFNDPITVVVNPDQSTQANLGETEEFFSIDKDNVIVSCVKKAEDSNDIVVRMYDADGQAVKVNLQSFFKLKGIQKTNIIEEYPKAVDQMEIKPFSIETYKLQVK